jgi:hypothetical protein
VNVKSLRAAICSIADILATSGRPQRPTLQTVMRLFEGHEEESLEEFLAGLRHRLARRLPTGRRAIQALDQIVVAQYVRRLQEAGTDPTVFESVFDDLSKDKAVRKAEANAIAQAYTGGRPQWPSRQKALEAVTTWFGTIAFNETKMRRV